MHPRHPDALGRTGFTCRFGRAGLSRSSKSASASCVVRILRGLFVASCDKGLHRSAALRRHRRPAHLRRQHHRARHQQLSTPPRQDSTSSRGQIEPRLVGPTRVDTASKGEPAGASTVIATGDRAHHERSHASMRAHRPNGRCLDGFGPGSGCNLNLLCGGRGPRPLFPMGKRGQPVLSSVALSRC